MGRDILLVSLVFAVIFLLGVQVLAETQSNFALQSSDDEFVIVIKPLPMSKLNFADRQEPPARATASLSAQDDSDFQIKIHPVAENR